ncbi:MAG: hypothetical protein AUK47_26180 [Deltaproteobacteria bacterium CG2_30_63_29]|nr:MAG: hypothetical protein AUK47_26180 [Deltaproteobacteria bacterium CG2_30_63_29]
MRLALTFVLVVLACGCDQKRQPEVDAAAAQAASRPEAQGATETPPAVGAAADKSAPDHSEKADGSPVSVAADDADVANAAAVEAAEAVLDPQEQAAAAPTAETPSQRTERKDGQGALRLAPELDHLVVRTQWPVGEVYGNVLYEGNNSAMRGAAESDGSYAISALDIAERWRTWGRVGRGVFMLRDSLWNQQDHVGRYAPVALMLSPSWLTVAVHEVSLGHASPRLGVPADPGNDEAWTALGPEALFGLFPPSETLHLWATETLTSSDALSAARIRVTRDTLVLLDGYLASLAEVAEHGPAAVAARGAELIAQSDRDYFTPELRRDAFIPLLVEHASPHEINDEGKSFHVSGREVPDAIIALTRSAVLRRRLADGDLAIERYDLSRASELDHLVEVLAPLVPAGDEGNTVWLWVTGPTEVEGEWKGPPALDYREALEAKLLAAGLNLDRIRVVTRNPEALSSKTPAAELASQAKAHGDAGWTLRLNLRAGALQKKLGEVGR